MGNVLVTGAGGLIGSESVKFFANKGFQVFGIDNDMRRYFFGNEASSSRNISQLMKHVPSYTHFSIDIRNKQSIEEIFNKIHFDIVIHCAAQPSHDWAAREPYTDFEINAYGTLILLENFRINSPDGVFIFTSTNKVYGDHPNSLPLIELETRYELTHCHPYYLGINENMSIDQSKHSLFGVSKASADLIVQEFGRYFGLKTVCFRGGCLTGPAHCPAELHGFLAYLVKCIATGRKYFIYGYNGKQVRDNIHSADLVNAFWNFTLEPRCGEVYNIGGSRHSNISMIEAIIKIEKILRKKPDIEYCETARSGDHIWYISDVSKFQSHYPNWTYMHDIDSIIKELCDVYLIS